MLIAVKYRADYPAWPQKIIKNVTTLPEGYDVIFTEANYNQYLLNNRAGYEAFLAQKAEFAALEAGASKFASVRAKWQNMADRYAIENSATGITTAQAAQIADAFTSVEKYLRLNVPTRALAEIDLISPIEPFLPQGKINSMKAELLAFIQETFNL